MKRFRLSTLVLLIVIAALCVTLVSPAISNARNSRRLLCLKGRLFFSEELAPCVAENRVRSRSLPTTYWPFNKLRVARPGLGIKSGGPASSWGSRTALRRKS